MSNKWESENFPPIIETSFWNQSVYQTQWWKMHFKTNRTNGETSKRKNSQFPGVEILFEWGRCTRLLTNFLFPLLLIFLWVFLVNFQSFCGWALRAAFITFKNPVRFFLVLFQSRFGFYHQMPFAARVHGGLVVVLSIQYFRLLVILVKKSIVSICSLKVNRWFFGYLNDGKYDKIAGIL